MESNVVKTEPSQKTEAEGWYQWYLDLKQSQGKKKAKSVWVAYWNKRAGTKSDANTRDLREKMLKEGIKLDTTWTGSIVDATDDVFDHIGSMFSFGEKLGKILAVGLGIGVIILVINVARKPVDTLKGVAAVKGV